MFQALFFFIVVSVKLVFFYTSCQPNWSLVSDVVFGGQEEVQMVIPLINKTKLGTQPKIFQDSLYMEPSINCTALSILNLIFFTPSMVFFLMSYFLRFYIIVARPANAHQETLAKPAQIIGLNLMGIIVSFLYVGKILSTQLQEQNQAPFTQACEAPDINTKLLHPIIANDLIVLNAVALTLSITIVYKVKKSTDSEHVKLVVYTLSHVFGFAFVVITLFLAKSANTSNMTRVSTVSD